MDLQEKKGIQGVEPDRFKARLVARGFTQNEGIDFNEVFSPVVKHRSIKILMAMVAEFDRVRTNGCEDNIFVWKA